MMSSDPALYFLSADGPYRIGSQGMERINIAQIVSGAWEHTLRVTPDPFDASDVLNGRFGSPRRSYRETLDRRRRNFDGELIPQIEIVRTNLRRLGKSPTEFKAPR